MNKIELLKELEKIDKKEFYNIIGDDFKVIVKSIINRAKCSNEIKIVNTGLVSSGKSSLFNILIDKIDEERFKTGAARTTVSQDCERIDENVLLIDTPGIDVREEDDEEAFKSILEADIILMIHNIKLGMPNRQEIEWLHKICDSIGDRESIKMRVVYVCSWIDERDLSEDYGVTIAETKRMVYEAAGTEIDFFEVSAKRYANGVKKKNDALKKKSNVLLLKRALLSKAGCFKENKVNEDVFSKNVYDFCAKSRNILCNVKMEREKEFISVQERINNEKNKKIKNWENVFSVFEMKCSKIKNLMEEIKNC